MPELAPSQPPSNQLTSRPPASARQKIGCWLHERWKAEFAIRAPGLARYFGITWQDLCNRSEDITVDKATGGRICHWPDSSRLTLARIFPTTGGRFLKHCLHRWPVRFQSSSDPATNPEVTFVIGVRGTARLQQFLATTESILGQTDCDVEVIVVEQSWKAEFKDIVPRGVQYVHTPATDEKMPFNRSWALNVGAKHARGRIVVLHDGDYVIPTRFAYEVSHRLRNGLEAVRLPRYIFYLNNQASRAVQETNSFDQVDEVAQIAQNNPTPMALTREAYLRIGGHDESFYGWGGEDNEFLDRVRTLNCSEGGFLPVFHLWHPEAPNRSGDRNADFLEGIMAAPATSRIQTLSARDFGNSLPSVEWHPQGGAID